MNKKNKQLVKHCPNYYKIINFEYFKDDDLSEKLLDVYQKYVFMVNPNQIALGYNKLLSDIDEYKDSKDNEQVTICST